MGEEDMMDSKCSACGYQNERRDCDGDWDTYCTYSGSCHYQKNVVDCDGDVITKCRR